MLDDGDCAGGRNESRKQHSMGKGGELKQCTKGSKSKKKGFHEPKIWNFGEQCFVWGMARGRWLFFEEQPNEEICESQYVPITASSGEKRPNGEAEMELALP